MPRLGAGVIIVLHGQVQFVRMALWSPTVFCTAISELPPKANTPHITPQETTNDDSGTIGADGSGLSASSDSVVTDGVERNPNHTTKND